MGRRVATYLAARTEADQGEEDEAVGDDRGGGRGGEDGDVDPDVVSAVGERHGGHGQDSDLLVGDLGLVIVVVTAVAPRSPCRVEAQGEGDEAK